MKKNESGFTLIELVVAMVVLSLLMGTFTLLMGSWIGKFNAKNLESKILIEAQALNASLKDSLRSMTCYHDYGNVVEIQLTKGTTDAWYYYIVDNGKAYLVSFNEKQSDVSTILYDNSDFLANYIESIDLEPNEYDTTGDNSNFFVDYHIVVEYHGIRHQTDGLVLLRNGH